jgi:solute:Na+ symporter, SSS family
LQTQETCSGSGSGIYIAITTGLSIWIRKFTKTSEQFMNASRSMPGAAVHQLGEYTVSGVIATKYGKTTQLMTSLIMIYALLVVNVAAYVGGTAAVTTVLRVSLPVGDLKSVAYVNVVHAFVKFLGVSIALGVGLYLAKGFAPVRASLPPFYFSTLGHIGLSTVIAWTIANIGTVFATQMIIQAVAGVKSPAEACKAALWAGVLIVPMGLMAAFVGVEAKYLFPKISSVLALPVFIRAMNPWLGDLVTIAIIASVFANVAASSLAITALIMKDFYVPYLKPAKEKHLTISRVMAAIVGVLPIPVALFVPQVIKTVVFARALRTTIAGVLVLGFFLPKFSSGKGAVIGLVGASVGATVWFLLGDPFGIDNAYVAAMIPLVVMGVDHLINRSKRKSEAAPAVGD